MYSKRSKSNRWVRMHTDKAFAVKVEKVLVVVAVLALCVAVVLHVVALLSTNSTR